MVRVSGRILGRSWLKALLSGLVAVSLFISNCETQEEELSPCDDSHFTDDDASFESVCDDDFSDDDADGCPGDDDTAGGTWLAKYAGSTKVELTIEGGQPQDIECPTTAKMSGHVDAFDGVIDCTGSSVVDSQWAFSGSMASSSMCIEGAVFATVQGISASDWNWMGNISQSGVDGTFRIQDDDYSAAGRMCLVTVPVGLYGLDPASGSTGGGYEVMIWGTGLGIPAETSICFGANEAQPASGGEYSPFGETPRLIVPESSTSGRVDLKVRNSDGIDVLHDAFHYSE